MNWEKSENIAEIIRVKDCLLVLYGTSACANTLPVIEILSPDEIRYSERLKNDRQKGTWLSCRSTLRQIMGSVLNLNPAEIEFKKGRFGKLYVAGSNLFFNVFELLIGQIIPVKNNRDKIQFFLTKIK